MTGEAAGLCKPRDECTSHSLSISVLCTDGNTCWTERKDICKPKEAPGCSLQRGTSSWELSAPSSVPVSNKMSPFKRGPASSLPHATHSWPTACFESRQGVPRAWKDPFVPFSWWEVAADEVRRDRAQQTTKPPST